MKENALRFVEKYQFHIRDLAWCAGGFVLAWMVCSKYTQIRIGNDVDKILNTSPELKDMFVDACAEVK